MGVRVIADVGTMGDGSRRDILDMGEEHNMEQPKAIHSLHKGLGDMEQDVHSYDMEFVVWAKEMRMVRDVEKVLLGALLVEKLDSYCRYCQNFDYLNLGEHWVMHVFSDP